MPAALTHKSIMLLARERIRGVRDALQSRQDAGQAMTGLEQHLLSLANQAFAMMSGPPSPELPNADPLTRRFFDVSTFAVMGSMGPDITAFSAMLAAGQAWAFDIVHKGSPDENREQVGARTTDFAFALYNRAMDGLLADDQAGKLGKGGLPRAIKKVQAYVLGHLCHVVGDVISHPYVHDIEWHQGTSSRKKFSHAGGEGSMDASVARRVLLRDSTREGQAWEVWWPTESDVPDALFRAYADALDSTYQTGTPLPANCFGEFLQRFKDLDPPKVSADFVRDGYQLYRHGGIGIVYGYGQWRWIGLLSLFLLPIVATAPLGALLPRTKPLFGPKGTATDEEVDAATASFLALPIAVSAPLLLGFGWWAFGLTHRGVETRTTLGMLSLVFTTLLLGLYVPDVLGVTGLKSWQRWLFFVVIPLATALPLLTVGLNEFKRVPAQKRRGGMTLLYGAPVFYFLLFLIIYLIWVHPHGDPFDTTTLTLLMVTLALMLFVVIVLKAKGIRDAKIPEQPEAFPLDPHFVRLFDDATLFKDGDGRRFFPAAGRALLKLWWEGGGDLYLRSRRYQLEFSFDGTTVAQVVPAPIVPMTPAEYGQLLTATVKDGGGATGQLKAEVAFPDDLVVPLPAGAAFADHGDDEETETVAAHDTEAAKFQKLGTAEAKAFVLRHAPKAAQAIRFGAFGPVPPAGEEQIVEREKGEGYHYVADGTDDTPGETVMDYAADVAALVCLGAVTELNKRSATTAAPVSSAAGAVDQVLRNWCLDRRRVNEWRMMVAGGALAEAGGPTDPLLAAGEKVANALGWVPLLRQWIGMVKAGGDAEDQAVRPSGFKNSELSQALAFLLPPPARPAP
ncbi:MAG TPA: zinc dependent phospholipase C family protein [Thermoanaerobaculia bacterium]|nr:zinc dependent phospholipase C family protein [Thermoanaerobaculia bacterium]